MKPDVSLSMKNPVLHFIFPRTLAVVHPARTRELVNLVLQAKNFAAYALSDLQAMTVEKVNEKELVS